MAEIKLETGECVIVDDATAIDFGRYQWRISQDGDVVSDMREAEVKLSRIVFGVARGDKVIVLHTNGNKLDCRKSNLSSDDTPQRGVRKVVKKKSAGLVE